MNVVTQLFGSTKCSVQTFGRNTVQGISRCAQPFLTSVPSLFTVGLDKVVFQGRVGGVFLAKLVDVCHLGDHCIQRLDVVLQLAITCALHKSLGAKALNN